MVVRTNEPEDTPRDRPFEDFRIPRTDKATTLVAEVLNQLQRYEDHFKLRRRKRKADDQKTFKVTVSAIVCDLCHRWLTEPDGWVAISLSKDALSRADRYKSPAMNKALPKILERLSSPEMSFVELQKGFQSFFGNGKQSTIRAGNRLISRIKDQGLTPKEIMQGNKTFAGGRLRVRHSLPFQNLEHIDSFLVLMDIIQMQLTNLVQPHTRV